MSEPTVVEERGQQRSGPQTGATPAASGNGGKAGGLRSKLRAASYDEGAQLLQPEAPVQLKPDPKGKPKPKGEVDVLKGKVGALEEENESLKGEVSDLRANDADQEREIEAGKAAAQATRAALVKSWEQDVGNGIDDVHAHLRDAEAAEAGLEELVERTLVADDQLRAGDKAVEVAIDAHKEAQKLGVLDGLNMIFDVANLLKSGITLVATVRKPVANGGTKAAKLGAAVDFATNAYGTAKDAADSVGNKEAAANGDTTVGMVAAVDTKVDALGGQVASLLTYAFGKEKHAVFSPLDAAARARNKVQDAANNLGPDLSTDLRTRVGGAHASLAAAGLDFANRAGQLEKLLKARDPRKGGGGELAKGTTGRSVFDIVATNPKACSLFAETTLRVTVKDVDDFATSTERTGYWLSVADSKLRTDLTLPLFPHQVQPLRPAGVGKCDQYVPAEIGQPLSTLITDTTELPYDKVRLFGDVDEEWATPEEWQNPDRRRSLLTPSTRNLIMDHR